MIFSLLAVPLAKGLQRSRSPQQLGQIPLIDFPCCIANALAMQLNAHQRKYLTSSFQPESPVMIGSGNESKSHTNTSI